MPKPKPARRSSRPAPKRDYLSSRPPIERMIAIHNTLKEDAFPNAQTLSRKLEVSSRTIQRDMEFMRDRLGLPIGYDESHFGFYYTQEVAAFPTIHLSEGELLALAFAKEALQSNQGTPYVGALATAFNKLASSLSATVSFSPGELAGLFSFRTAGHAPVDEALFVPLGQAVLEHQEVSFVYRKTPDAEPERRQVEPYHIASINGLWYLAARDLDRDAMRTFALTRMSELTLHKRHFKRPSDFSPDVYFGDSFGPFRGDTAETVRIFFDSYAANLIRERIWHRSQVIEEKSDGCLVLQLHVRDRYETLRWVLSWGDQLMREKALLALESKNFEPLRILTGSPETRSDPQKFGSIRSIRNFNPFDEVSDPNLRLRIIAWHAGNNTIEFVEKTSAKISQITDKAEIVALIRDLNHQCTQES